MDIPGFDDFVEIGRGGFGVVYRAEQSALGRTVAVKLLAVGQVDPDALHRFEREGRILGQLSEHPNIVTVHDSGTTADGRPWVAMAYLPNGSLGDRLRADGPLPPDEVASIGVRIAGALETAHRAGIFHRDVKPENILLTSYGEPSLADFGIARMVGGTQTVAGAVTASLTHAAPEVLEGAPPGPAGDVYALASTLFTLVNGRAAFDPGPDGAVSQLIAGIVSKPVPDLRQVGVPDPLAAAIELGLSRDLDDRPATASEFAEVLRQAQQEAGWPLTDAVVLDPDVAAPTPRPAAPGDDDVTRMHSVTGPGAPPAEPIDEPAPRPTPPAATPPPATPPPSAEPAQPIATTDPPTSGTRPDAGGGRGKLVAAGVGVAAVVAAAAVGLSGGGGSSSEDTMDRPTTPASEDDGSPTDDEAPRAGSLPTPLFTEGPNDGEGRVLFRVELPALPIEAVTDGLALYVATEATIEARTLEDGIVRWSVARAEPGTSPVGLGVGEGVVWFSDGDDLVGLSVGSGGEVVRTRVDGAPTRPHVTDQGVVLAIAGPTIERLDGQGQPLWQVTKPLAEGEQYVVHQHLEDEPVVVTTDTQVLAIETDSGQTRWTNTLPDHEVLQVVQGNAKVVVAGATDRAITLLGINHVTGEVTWETNRGAPDVDGVRLELEDGVLVLADGEVLVGIDSNSGQPDWQWPFPVGDDSAIAVGIGQVVAVGDAGAGPEFTALSVYSGEPTCSTIPTTFPEWPVRLAGRWEFMDTEGTYLSLDGVYDQPQGDVDCDLTWTYDLPLDANAAFAPVYAHDLGHVYVLDDNSWLTGLRMWEQ